MRLFEEKDLFKRRRLGYHRPYWETFKNKTHIILLLVFSIVTLILLMYSTINFIFWRPDNTFESVENAVEIVWDYHHLHHKLIDNPDGILVFCSSDINVADVAGKLFWKYFDNNPNLYILFSGGIGTGIHSGTNLLGWKHAEAIMFKNRVSKTFIGKDYKDIPIENILIERYAKNSGENVDFSRIILEQQNKQFDKIILVQKPFMERRAFATLKKRWINGPSEICVQSSSMNWQEYYKVNPVDKDIIISIMVGDLQRVKYYAEPYGDFQIPQEIPEYVWNAFQYLVSKGYTDNLMSNKI
eukprot:22712_1